MIMELFSPEYRTAVGTIFEVFWAGGIMWLAMVGWMLRDWRHIQLLLTLPSVVTIVYIWLVEKERERLRDKFKCHVLMVVIILRTSYLTTLISFIVCSDNSCACSLAINIFCLIAK